MVREQQHHLLCASGHLALAFQVIGQAKVVFTVVLLYFLMGRHFNLQQLLSLAVLSCALIITGEEEDANRVHQGRREPGSHYTLNVGVAVLLTLVIAFNGSLAGVYNEKMLKELNSSLHFQNALLTRGAACSTSAGCFSSSVRARSFW